MIAIAFLATGAGAFASGYDDYTRAYAARRAGNVDLALTAYTAALAAPDLAATYVPDAHVGRADMLLRKGRCAEAITDLDAALAARPALIEALTMRAGAHTCLNQKEAAQADYDAAVAASPTTVLFSSRAEFRWHQGDFAAAAEDYMKAVKAQNKRTFEPRQGQYALLGYAISAARAKTFDASAFAAAAKTLPDDEWPAPLIDFIAGKIKIEAVQREAALGDGDTPAYRRCQTGYYVGEWKYAGGDPAGKAMLLELESICPKNAAVLRGARIDLRRIP
jgi:tetratricopeptide (TPR) repeat protein